ncbi:MAG: L-threonylcarbamoyladenylate synthase [Nanoarchaeota archaeon]
MEIITKEELFLSKMSIYKRIEQGDVFIHPTDTIYGIGCSALSSEAVKRVRKIKNRPVTPFSIIVPSCEWIYNNCFINKESKRWIEILPGAYTLILNKNNTKIVEEVAPNINTIGVRIPKHWISDVVNELGFPIITTSVNLVGESFMTSLENLNPKVSKNIDFIMYEGVKVGSPSKIIDLTKEIRIIER